MIERLIMKDDEHPDPRGDLDALLNTAQWSTPVTRPAVNESTLLGAPTWWHGEEDASQSFFKAMGIDPARLEG